MGVMFPVVIVLDSIRHWCYGIASLAHSVSGVAEEGKRMGGPANCRWNLD